MMKKRMYKILIPLSCFALIFGAIFGNRISGTMAYLSNKASIKTNKFMVGDVVIGVMEQFDAPSNLTVGANVFKKDVKLKNNGSLPAYVRANVLFSNMDVGNISKVSGDGGNTWYSLEEFKRHLPTGWTYQSAGALSGYYYYDKALAPGTSTPSLITHVQTTFETKTADTNTSINRTPRDYDIFVYGEGVQQYKLDGSGIWTDYGDAWTAFLNKKG